MRYTQRIIGSLVHAAAILLLANALFYAPSVVRWQCNRSAVVKEIQTRNKFWQVTRLEQSWCVPSPSETARKEKIQALLTPDDIRAPWYTLAQLIDKRDERVLRLDPKRIGKVQLEWYSLIADTIVREGDGLDWAIKWHHVYADTAKYDYSGALVARRSSWCVTGKQFTRTFAYELCLTMSCGADDVQLPTSQRPPVAPLFVLYDEELVPLFPIGRHPSTWLAALLQLALLAVGWFCFDTLVLLPNEQRVKAWEAEQRKLEEERRRRAAEQKRTAPPAARPITAAVRNAPGPLQQELQQLRTLEQQLVDASAGYGRDLPELARVRALIARVKQANVHGKVRDRAEPDSPVATMMENAATIMDTIEARLEMED